MAAEDNLDIDIYGEDGNENADYNEEGTEEYTFDDESGLAQTDGLTDTPADEPQSSQSPVSQSAKQEPAPSKSQPPSQQQGTKRKESSDERPIDPGSTPALMISELHWWTTEDDIRGWASQAHCEDELKDVTFSEHKVNGKSKGQAYVDFESAAAATAMKHIIESLAEDKPARKFAVNFTNHLHNPFRTHPKDAPARKEESRRGAYNNGPPHQPSYANNSFRGRGGGGVGNFNNRGNYNNTAGNFNNNRNFSGGGMNMNMNGGGGYNQNVGGGFQQNPMMTGFNNGFNRSGGGMAMRGGRGGGVMNQGMGMPMGGMPMGGMPMGMGMGPMMGGMGIGFQGGFNPAMFQGQAGWGGVQQQQGGPNKRQRQE